MLKSQLHISPLPINPSYDPHLLIILGKGCSHGIFVDCLHNANDFSIAVADGHAEDGLSLVAGQLVDLVAEAVVLQEPRQLNRSYIYMFQLK